MGKAIYQPKGRAGEFSKYAANFYNGCSGDCKYCFNKRWTAIWSTTPTLKKTLIHELTAYEIFRKEAVKNLEALRQHGLLFNFNSDPFLRETIDLNVRAMDLCQHLDIPVIALTKQTWWIHRYTNLPKNVSIGYTLTGHDELEPGAASNRKRIEAMEFLHGRGYKIWASIEPVIDIENSIKMIRNTLNFCNHYKIGTLSGKKYNKEDLKIFVDTMAPGITGYATVYFKDELLKQAGVSREFLNSWWSGCVDRDYR